MPSKKATAKELQEYREKPVHNICSNCKFFKSDDIQTEYGYTQEKNLRCDLGKFKVKKTSTCNRHEFKQEIS